MQLAVLKNHWGEMTDTASAPQKTRLKKQNTQILLPGQGTERSVLNMTFGGDEGDRKK